MKKENILVIVLICIAFGGVMLYQRSQSSVSPNTVSETGSETVKSSDSINWNKFKSGIALAKSENKPVFLYFYADWCTYCKQLKKTTFKDSEVLKYLEKHFISIKVDTEVDRQLATDWNVRGLPTSWFLKSDSTKIDSVPGYMDEEQFLSILKYIQTKSYDKMSFTEFMKTI